MRQNFNNNTYCLYTVHNYNGRVTSMLYIVNVSMQVVPNIFLNVYYTTEVYNDQM